MNKFNSMTKACGVFLLWTAAAVALPAQTVPVTSAAPKFTTLHTFENTDGANPQGTLIQAADGNFYGTTVQGGDGDCMSTFGCGTIFKITPNGTLTSLYSFCSGDNVSCPDGAYLGSGLIQATDGNLYGTTLEGGANTCSPFDGCGTVFRITPSGTLTTLHSFDGTDGNYPEAALIEAADGKFYGMTASGGACPYVCGTAFSITEGGTLTTLYSFCSKGDYPDCTDGERPEATLIQDTDGNLYGTTNAGGRLDYEYCADNLSCGTVFKITPSGIVTTLHRFCSQAACTDGANPVAGLVQDADGNFYGTTRFGGKYQCYDYLGCGTVFKITTSGTFTVLYNFCSESGCTDGSEPEAGLIQGTDGNFYGATYQGGNKSSACGGPLGGCGDCFQNHAKWHTDDAAQLRRDGRLKPIRGPGTRHRRDFLRDNGAGWGQ